MMELKSRNEPRSVSGEQMTELQGLPHQTKILLVHFTDTVVMIFSRNRSAFPQFTLLFTTSTLHTALAIE